MSSIPLSIPNFGFLCNSFLQHCLSLIFTWFSQVMRVIIFDQLGNVLNKFGCSKHLEFPNGVVVNDRQEIFISDNRAHCVKVFDYEGNFLRQIGGEGRDKILQTTRKQKLMKIWIRLTLSFSPILNKLSRDHKLPDRRWHQRCRGDHHCGQPQQLQPLGLLTRWPAHIRTREQGEFGWLYFYKVYFLGGYYPGDIISIT